MNGFPELPATLVCELGCHVGIDFKRVGFELYIYTEFTWLLGVPLQFQILDTPLRVLCAFGPIGEWECPSSYLIVML